MIKLIVGLGNPDKKYAKTRHNVGWMVLDRLAPADARWQENKENKILCCKTEINGRTVVLMKPLTYMNNSGLAVAAAVKRRGLDIADNLIVAHDDKDLALGVVKTQANRGSAGHNGVQSIIQCLGTQNFTRVRVGVANKNERLMSDASKFVLSRFGLLEKKKLKEAIAEAADAIKKLIPPIN